MFMVDVACMGYIYKSYYGRYITEEIGNDNKWNFNDNLHKYSEKPAHELVKAQELNIYKTNLVKEKYVDKQKRREHKKEEERQILKKEEERQILKKEEKQQILKKEEKQQIQSIIDNKNKVRATIKLQHWWRDKLYAPPNGLFYVQAKKSFQNNIKLNS
jgi:hypothetical protein